VKEAKAYLKDAEPKIATVIGFPLGHMTTAAKVFEAEQAVKDGADEIDMVINIGYLKSGNLGAV
jgi:deoxyribose-phosphate aldolase